MPPPPLDSILSPLLHGPVRGLGATNRVDNDRPGGIVLDDSEATDFVAKLRPYRQDFLGGPKRHQDTLRDLHQKVADGSLELSSKARATINRYAFFSGLGSLNFKASDSCQLGATLGRTDAS